MRSLRARVESLLRLGPVDRLCDVVFRAWISALVRLEPATALRRLLLLDDHLLRRVDLLAIELDGGVHAKHRIMRYHDFFVDRVEPGERVLDVGCGKAELAHDLAERGGAFVTGVDVNARSLAFARERFPHERLEVVEADVLTWNPPGPFDVVVLSNVLEHIEHRPALLRRLVELATPQRLLIRVPVLERDWIVGLRRELGLAYFSDPTHETEYDPAQLAGELAEAGFRIVDLEQRWGELWAVATPEESRDTPAILGRP